LRDRESCPMPEQTHLKRVGFGGHLRTGAEPFDMHGKRIDAERLRVTAHCIHHGTRPAGVDMPARWHPPQRRLEVGPAVMFVIGMQHDPIRKWRELLKIPGMAPRARAIQQTPRVPEVDTPADHAQDRCNANASGYKQMAWSRLLQPEQRSRYSHMQGITEPQLPMGKTRAAARRCSQADAEPIAGPVGRRTGNRILPRKAIWKAYVNMCARFKRRQRLTRRMLKLDTEHAFGLCRGGTRVGGRPRWPTARHKSMPSELAVVPLWTALWAARDRTSATGRSATLSLLFVYANNFRMRVRRAPRTKSARSATVAFGTMQTS